ncbi:MAG: cysteine peptidase family C39 domain-containing protein, partial [Candidatus Omnitrophica bacterium]|nr:cysteine peptidase family C39 domain-containing protein [Candidatus Omnitrophota bacterium]
MLLPNKLKFLFRTISVCVIFLFLWQQITWAAGADLLNNTVTTTETTSDGMTPEALKSSQNTVESIITTKNAIETSKASSTPSYTYTYYKSGLIQSVTLSSPDQFGNIYYYYLNENWNGQGHGRIFKTKRQDPLDGELSYIYYYYGKTDRIRIRRGYATSTWTKLSSNYYYNNNAANRLSYRQLAAPDSQGFIYYHYIDEDFNGQGYGRVDKTRRKVALNGELSYTYIYYANSDRIQTASAYGTASWTKLRSTYTYYNNDSNRIESNTLITADKSGNVYYHYLDENWQSQGYGRVDKKVRKTADLSDAKSYTFIYHPGMDKVKYEYDYRNSDFTSLFVIKEYNTAGVIIKTTQVSDGTYTFYASGRFESVTYAVPDASGNTYYHYLDEDWNGQGYGRVDKSRRQTASNGELTYAYIYYADGTGRLKEKRSYSDNNWTSLVSIYTYYNDSNGRLQSKYDPSTGITTAYYNDSNNRIESRTLATPDAGGNIYYHYLNEDWNNQGYGKIDRQDASNGDFVTFEYWSSGNKKVEAFFEQDSTWQKTIEYWEDGITLRRYEIADYNPSPTGIEVCYDYDNQGQLIKKTFDNGDFITYEYWSSGNEKQEAFFDVNWNWQRTIEYWEDGSTLHHQWFADYDPTPTRYLVYCEYDDLGRVINNSFDNDDRLLIEYWLSGNKKQDAFFKENWTWQYTIEYWDNATSIKHYEWIADANTGTAGDITNYEYDEQERVVAERFDTGDFVLIEYWSSGNKKQDAFFKQDWTWQYTIEYWDSTTSIKHYEWITDANPGAEGDVVYCEHNSTGAAIKLTYDNGETCEYDDQGRVTKKTLPNGDFILTEYWSSGNKKIDEFFSAENVWQKTIKYWDDANNYIESVSLAIPDTDGNSYYHYLDENWQNQGYGKIDRLRRSDADEEGAIGYEYTYYYNGMTTGDSESDGQNEIIADFGYDGLWIYRNNEWTRLSTYDADACSIADATGDDKNDIIVDFGSKGFFVYSNNGWTQLSTYDAEVFTIADATGDGKNDIIVDFGSKGFFVYSNNSWTLISTYDAEVFTIADATGDGKNDIIVDFGSKGFFVYSNNGWTQLSQWDVEIFSIADVTGDDKNEIIGDFGDNGFWVYSNGSWNEPSIWDAEAFTVTEVTGDGKNDIICDFGNNGLWLYSNSAWTQLTDDNAKTYTITDITGDGVNDFLGDFGSGFWMYSNNAWTRLTEDRPASYTISDITGDGIKDFLGDFYSGFWMYSNGAWTRLTDGRPNSYITVDMTGDGIDDFLGDFGRAGIWLWDVNAGWSQINTATTDDKTVKKCYANADFTSLIATYEYNSKGQAIKKTLPNGNFIMYEYWSSGNKKQDAFFKQDWTWQYTIEYWDSTTSIKHYEWITDANPGAEGDIVYYEYDSTGAVIKLVYDYGETYEYGDQGRIAKRTLPNGDYILTEYWSSGNKKIDEFFSAENVWQKTIKYWDDANNYIESVSLAIPDTDGNIYYHYLNENWNNQRYGRIDKRVLNTADSSGAKSYTFEYHDNTAVVKYEYRYKNSDFTSLFITKEYDASGVLIKTTQVAEGAYTYYASGRLESVTYTVPDASGNIYYHYLDENWNDQDLGRVDKAIRSVLDADNAMAYQYEYLAEEDRIIKSCYAQADYSDPSNPIFGTIVAKYVYKSSDGSGERLFDDTTGIYSTDYFYDAEGLLSGYYEYFTNGEIVIYDKDGNIIYSYTSSSNQDSSGNLSVTTSSGDIIEYQGDAIVYVRLKSDNSVLTNIRLNEAGDLDCALITYVDGTKNIVYGGHLIQTRLPDGTLVKYKDDKKAAEYSSIIGLTTFEYIKDDGGALEYIKTSNDKAVCLYDANGLPIKFTKSNGEITEYENGHVKKIVTEEGVEYLYNFISEGSLRSELVGTTADEAIPAIIYYDENGHITSVVNAEGDTLEYADNLPTSITIDGQTVSYDFSQGVTVDKAGVTMHYDPNTGELISLEKDGVEILFDNGDGGRISFRMLDGSLLTAPVFDGNGDITDGIFEKKDADGKVISRSEYVNGKVVLYIDETGNEYRYDTEGNLTELKMKTAGGDFVTYIYTKKDIVTAEVSDADKQFLNDNDPVIIKYENIDTGRRIIYLETKDGHYKSFDYAADGITVTEGTIQVLDSQKMLIKDTIKKYDSSLRLISCLQKDGTINNYTYNNDSTITITVIKDGISYIIEGDKLTKSIKNGLTTTYYESGLVKSTEIAPGVVKDFKYGINNNLMLNTPSTIENGTLNDIAYGGTDFKLDYEHLDYGDGHDGTLEIRNDGVYINGVFQSSGNTYVIDGPKQYSRIYVAPGATLTVLQPWNGTSGGDLILRCTGEVNIEGRVTVDAMGYRGGAGGGWRSGGVQGESYAGTGSTSMSNNLGGGGAGHGSVENVAQGQPGAGGSYGTAASDLPTYWGIVYGGTTYGDPGLTTLYRGSGGGGGGDDGAGHSGGYGGTGGGIIRIAATSITVASNASITANGGNGAPGGQYHNVGGGGGSGGSILLIAENVTVDGSITARGGFGTDGGGNGGDGRICIDYCTLNVTGTVGPQAYTQQYNYVSQGTFDSGVIEVDTPYFQSMSWAEDLPTGTDVTFQTRTGNTLTPDASWTEWSDSMTDPSGAKISSNGAKYIQFRITLKTSDKTVTPKIILSGTDGINISYVKIQDNDIDINDVALVETIQGTSINYYTPDGKNINDPNDVVDVMGMAIGQSFMNSLLSDGKMYAGEVLDLNPGTGISFAESSKTLWDGRINVDDITKVADDEPVRIEYELINDGQTTTKRVLSYDRKNGNEVYYDYSGNKKVVEFVKGEDGNISYRIVTSYNASGIIQEMQFLYGDETKNKIITYENGLKKKVTQNGVDILTYDYEMLDSGEEATVINDFTSGDATPVKKYYVNGQLQKIVDKDGVETHYLYDESGKILESSIYRAGKEMEVYKYSYDEDDQTIIEDSDGVKKTYDKDGKLLWMEKDNKLYAYYYSVSPLLADGSDIENIKSYMQALKDMKVSGQYNDLLRDTDLATEFGVIEDSYEYNPSGDFAVEELIQLTDKDGNIIKFNDGEIESITRPDGIIISDIIYNDGKVSGYVITLPSPSESGVVMYVIKDNYISSEKKEDNSTINFYPNGWVKSKVDTSGAEIIYIYKVALVYTGSSEGETYYTKISKEETADWLDLITEDGITEGTFTSDVIEVNAESIGKISWEEIVPEGTDVEIRIRAGNSDDPEDGTWSDWSLPFSDASGSIIPSDFSADKYLQYMITLKGSEAGDVPRVNLKSVKIELISDFSDGNDHSLQHYVDVDGKTYVYDSRERLMKIIDGDTIYRYTSDGMIGSIEYADGKTISYVYDERDITLLEKIIVKEDDTELHYDSSNRLTTVINSTTGFRYDYFYNGDITSVRTTYTNKDSTANDFGDFDKDGIVIDETGGMLRIKLDRQIPLDYGDGSDGVLTVKKGETVVLEARTYNFESIYVEEGAILTVEPWNETTGGQLIIRCQKDAVIDGAIDLAGKGYTGGKGNIEAGASGAGPGAGSGAPREGGFAGGGGGYATNGQSADALGGSAYGTAELLTSYMGSGGGGGSGYNTYIGDYGGTGGNGGGILQITAPIINVNGSISVNGANGEDSVWNGIDRRQIGGAGGGGSGGSLLLSGEQVSIAGTVLANGGYGGSIARRGGDGSPGRIRIDYGVMEGGIFAETDEASPIQKASVYKEQLKYVNSGTLTSDVIDLSGVDMANNKKVYLNANLDIPILSNVKIETRTSNSADGGWSDWEETTLGQDGFEINSPLNSFIQYRITLTTKDENETPSIYSLNDFAIKLSFVSEKHFENMASEDFMAPNILGEIALPTIIDTASQRIQDISGVDGAAIAPAGWQDLISRTPSYTIQDLGDFLKDIYTNALNSDETIATKYLVGDNNTMKTEYVQRKDGTIEHYDTETGKIMFVTDKDGSLSVRYYYDDEGSLRDVRFWGERRTLSHEIAVVQNEILKKKLEDLSRLAEEVGAGYQELDKQVKDLQDQIDAARFEIEASRYITYEAEVASFFGRKKVSIVVENPYYSQMMALIDDTERRFHDNAAVSYFALDNMYNVSKGRIEAASLAALSNVERQKEVTMTQILRKELTSIIYDNYLKYLGRLPSNEELNKIIADLASKSEPVVAPYIQDTYTINRTALKADLESREERTKRLEFVQRIYDAVGAGIQKYFESDTARSELISQLKLVGEDLVNLTIDDANAILNWLSTSIQKTLHFGQSAFLALKEIVDFFLGKLLDSAADDERYVKIAANAILIDILAGVINPFTEGELQISMFAMAKAAQVESVMLEAYKMDWEALLEEVAEYKTAGDQRVIAHIKGNHYVVITGIDAEGNVTYFEPSMGENGEMVTIAKEEFAKIWKGYILTNKDPPTNKDYEYKKLSSLEAQQIKGSGDPFTLLMIVSIALSIISFALSFIDNEFAQLLSKILGVVAVITAGISILGQIASTIGQVLAKGMQSLMSLFVTTFKILVANVAKPFTDIGTAFTFGKIGQTVLSTIIAIPMSITVSRGLETLGVNPVLARLLTTFVTAGMTSFTGTGSFNFAGAFSGLAFQGTTELCNIFNLPQNITSLISISAGALVESGLDGFTNGVMLPDDTLVKGVDGALLSIGDAFSTTILPNVASELSYYGITRLGEMIGVDPRISYL